MYGSPENNPIESLATTREQQKQFVRKRLKVDLSPVVYVMAHKIQQQSFTTRAMTVLLDSDSSHTMIKKSSLPHGTIPTLTTPQSATTTNGVFATSSTITLQNVKFQEFGNHHIHNITADVFNSPTCQYDVILGRDILKLMGLMIDFQQHTITWMGRTIPMKSRKQMSMKATYMEQYYNHLEAEEDEDFELLAELYADDVVIPSSVP